MILLLANIVFLAEAELALTHNTQRKMKLFSLVLSLVLFI